MLALLTGRRAPGRRSQRPPEVRWYEYLTYPLHDWRLWLGPAGVLTLLSAAGLLFGPELLAQAVRRDHGPSGSLVGRPAGAVRRRLPLQLPGTRAALGGGRR